MVVLCQILFRTFGHTSHNPDEKALSFLFQGVQGLQSVPYLLLGVLAYGTGVQEYGIGLIDAPGRLISGHPHNRGNNLAVGHVHLAAVSLND